MFRTRYPRCWGKNGKTLKPNSVCGVGLRRGTVHEPAQSMVYFPCPSTNVKKKKIEPRFAFEVTGGSFLGVVGSMVCFSNMQFLKTANKVKGL
jgi:hypothetical protein